MSSILPARRAVVRWGAPLAACALLASALACLTVPARAGAQTAHDEHEQMERPEVTAVRFVGAQQLKTGDLQEAIATQASHCLGIALTPICWITKSPAVYERRYLDRQELARDVVRLLVYYYKHGWRDARVDTTVARSGVNAVRVTFTIQEGAPTLVRSIAVNDSPPTLRPRAVNRLVSLRVGQPLDLLKLDSSVVRLRDAYWNRGFGDAVVEKPVIAADSAADTAGVRIVVRRGPRTTIASVSVLHIGPQRIVSDQTIRNSLSFEPGQLFRRAEVARSQRALYESGLFRSALIDTAVAREQGSGRLVCASQASGAAQAPSPAAAARADSTKALVVCVAEGPLREARTSFGFSTADFAQVEGQFTHNYWLGGPRRLTLSAAVGNLGARQLWQSFPFRGVNGFAVGPEGASEVGRYFAPTYSGGIDVRQRWFQSPRNTLGLGAFVHRRSSPGVFVDRGQGGNVTFTRNLTEQVPLSGTYRFEVSRVEAGDVYFCVNYGVCDRTTISALRGQQRLSPLAATLSSNSTNAAFSPTRGVLTRVELEHASSFTASQYRYNRAYAEASTYRQLPFRRAVLALRARGGWVAALAGTNEAIRVSPTGDGDLDEVLHPRKRFYAGGSQSVRGFGENQLGPRVLTIAPDDIRGVNDSATKATGRTVYVCAPPTTLPQCFAQRRDQIPDDRFTARPLGGTTLVEGNVELRVPVWNQLWGAVFVDGAVLGERTLRDVASGTRAVTPGIGIRYHSPVGPVRVDMGFRPTLKERLPVITQVDDSTGRSLLELGTDRTCRADAATNGCRLFPQAGTTGVKGFLNRITLHLSIGEAF